MLKSLKYTIFIGIVLVLSCCVSSSKTQFSKSIQLNEKQTINVSEEYKGAGYHGTEDGNAFILNNEDKTVKLYFEAVEGRELRKIFYNETPDSLPGLDQMKKIGKCYLYYTNSNGMTYRNSSAIVFFPVKGDYIEVLTISYVAEKQEEVEKIVASIK